MRTKNLGSYLECGWGWDIINFYFTGNQEKSEKGDLIAEEEPSTWGSMKREAQKKEIVSSISQVLWIQETGRRPVGGSAWGGAEAEWRLRPER